MKIIKSKWQYIFWIGPFLTIAGLTAGFISGIWQPIPLGMVIAGLIVSGLWLIYTAQTQGFWGRRSTQANTNALFATLSVLLILGLINFLGVRYATRLDLTETQQFTLAPQSQQILRELKQPVKVWVFDRIPNPQSKELLENYRRLGHGEFSFEFVDPQVQPGIAQQFGILDFGEVYLESGQQRQLVQKVKLEPISEAKLTNALEQIISKRIPKAYFLQGHGERRLEEGQGGFSEAEKALKDKNYTVEALNLAEKPGVPADADVVIVAGPQKPLLEGEVKALKEYLQRGGSLFVMLDPNTKTGLDSLLNEWGVSLDDRLAVDVSGSGRTVGLGPTVPLVKSYGNHPITQSFGNGISFYPFARPVETKPVTGVEVKPLIFTNEQSWAKKDLTTRKLEFDEQKDRKGPLILGVALTRPVGNAASDRSQSPSPSPSPVVSPKASPTPSPSVSPSVSPTPSPSVSPTLSPSVSPSASPTPSPSVSPSVSPTPSPTTSPSASSTPSATPSPTTSPSVSPRSSLNSSPTALLAVDEASSPNSPTASLVSYSVAVASPSASPSTTPSASPSTTPSATPSTTPSTTPSASPSASPLASPSASPSATPSPTPSPTPSSTPTPTKQSRLVVLGNSQFATNGWFEQQLNGDVFLNSVSWLSQPDRDTLSISPKKVTNRRIAMTLEQARVLSWMALVILPLFGFGMGGILWWRRR
ncbi:MAG: Gldg family protein [Actinomycetota bacterium]